MLEEPSSVRPAEHADMEQMLDLLEVVAAEGLWIGSEAPIDRAVKREGFQQAIDSDDDEVFIAAPGGVVVGFISLWKRHGVVDLGMLVGPEWRGQGVGRRLLEEGIGWAKQRGAHKMALQVWPHNAAAIALYHRYGFHREGHLRRHWRRRNGELWDSLLMGLQLEEGDRRGHLG